MTSYAACFYKYQMISKNKMNSYCCMFCDSLLNSTFYMCLNLHLCCFNCRLLGGFCPDCHVLQILCCSLRFYETSPKAPLFNEVGGIGPIISLPEGVNGDKKELCFKCPSCENNEATPSRLFNCPDCGRFLSSLWLVEHYQRDHPTTHVCPIPPGGCLSFKLKLNDIEIGKVKRLQVMKIIPSDWLRQSSKSEEPDSEDQILFVMATRTPYFKSKTALLLWLASCFHTCLLSYTIEARGERNNLASALFTGSPVSPKIMEEISKGTIKCEEIGEYLSIKESLVKAFETEGNGVVINILIYKNN